MDNENNELGGFQYRLSGHQVSQVRIAAGLTQVGLAKRIGVTQSTIWRLEAAKDRILTGPSVILICQIASQVKDKLPPEMHGLVMDHIV